MFLSVLKRRDPQPRGGGGGGGGDGGGGVIMYPAQVQGAEAPAQLRSTRLPRPFAAMKFDVLLLTRWGRFVRGLMVF